MKTILNRIFIIMLFVAVPVLSSGQEGDAPRIVINKTRFEAGKVTQGTRVSHVFEIKNTGGATLVINRVQAG